MKVCRDCGVEIGTLDGDNLCQACEEVETTRALHNRRRQLAREEREAVMRSLGLAKVKGALGGTYWE